MDNRVLGVVVCYCVELVTVLLYLYGVLLCYYVGFMLQLIFIQYRSATVYSNTSLELTVSLINTRDVLFSIETDQSLYQSAYVPQYVGSTDILNKSVLQKFQPFPCFQ